MNTVHSEGLQLSFVYKKLEMGIKALKKLQEVMPWEMKKKLGNFAHQFLEFLGNIYLRLGQPSRTTNKFKQNLAKEITHRFISLNRKPGLQDKLLSCTAVYC